MIDLDETTILDCDDGKYCKLELRFYENSVVESWLVELSCSIHCKPQVDYVTYQPYVYQQNCCDSHVCVWKTYNNRLFLDYVQRPEGINPTTTSNTLSTGSYSTPAVSETLLTPSINDTSNMDLPMLDWEACKHKCHYEFSVCINIFLFDVGQQAVLLGTTNIMNFALIVSLIVIVRHYKKWKHRNCE